MTTLRELGEIAVLERLLAGLEPGAGVRLGPGDDAALLEPAPGRALAATTDTFVEGVHYRVEWSAPEAIGARLAAANLSDLAAMAARPRWALLAIGARRDGDLESVVGIQRGLGAALARHGASIVGGNLTSSADAEWLTLTLLGDVAPDRAWRRSGARPGDLVAVTGLPGRAGAGAALAMRLGSRARAPEWRALLDAWLVPEPRVGLALALAESGAVTAAIDVSDGLAGDLDRLCTASGRGAELSARDFPEDAVLEGAAAALGSTVDRLRLAPSDDYELLLAVDPAQREACATVAAARGVPIAFIGRITDEPGMTWVGETGARAPIETQGYDAFRTETR
jgi:thiamine-monophosphate kinase